MRTWKKFPRALFLFTLLAGVSGPAQRGEIVHAAPMRANALDVIISEVAWGGTAASTADEWIELYNPTGSDIVLTGWTLASSDASPTISLSGTIPAGGYFLLERTDDSTVSGIPASQIYTGDLGNGGEVLTLQDNNVPTANIIDTANISGAGWDAGSAASNYYSMERIGVVADSGTAWSSNNGVTRNGLDASGVAINGTPGQQNSSVNVDLSLSISPPSTIVSVGSPVSFTVTINNNSSAFSATGVNVNVVLSSGLSLDSAVPSSGTFNLSVWTLASLANGASATLTINATVLSSGTVFAQISGINQTDPDSSNNSFSASVATPPTGSANVSVAKSVNNASPNVNDNIVFSITVGNAGPGTATSVVINDDLPAGLAYVSDNGGGAYNNATGEWTIPSLTTGSSTILRITARVVNAGAKTNTASVQSLGQTDPDLTDNSSSVTVTPGGGIADLSLTQAVPIKSTVTAGYAILTITVDNRAGAGLYNATNVIVKDDLPTGLTYVSDDGGGTYNKDTGMWSAGGISNGASKSLKITVKVDPTGTLLNEAEIWSVDQSDPDSTPGDGSITQDDYDSIPVQSADLSITKSMDNVTPVVGTDVVFTIRVLNNGPDDATNVQVKDKLPSSYSYLSDNSASVSDSTGVATSYDSGTGIWDIGQINDGASMTLNITATVVSTATVNWAEVWTVDQVDIDSVSGNSSQNSDDDASAPSADLRLDQTIVSNYPGLNTIYTYTITVTNDGTVGATNVQVKDKPPSGVTYVSNSCAIALPATGTCTYASSGILWTLPSLANGASAVLTFKAQMTSSGVRTNWAEVWKSSLPDPDSTPANNSQTEDDDASTTVSHRPILINEVAWAGTSSGLSEDQWMELYNPNSVAVNITGWILSAADGEPSIILNGTIAAGGYFLLERDSNTTVSDNTANQIYIGALETGGETLTLRDGVNVIDTANKSGGSWPRGGGTNYASMERQGNTAENDDVWVTNTGVTRNGLNANGGNIYGTPGRKNSTGVAPTATPIIVPPTAVPIVRPVINEFLARPGFDWNQDGKVDVFDEFIEIKNIGVVDVNLTGWKLDDEANQGSNPFTIPSLTLKPGQHAIFYGIQTNILLSDGGDTVRLLNPSNKVYDAYTYAIAKVEDRSVCRLPDGNGSWYEDCVPTPNLSNSREGEVPSMPEGEEFESPVCDLPDTLPADFLFAECRGYGADIWHSFFWDKSGWQGDQYVPENMSKWESFVE